MHVVFVEPCFPANQREFLRGLLSTGARVSAISERPDSALPAELREGLFQYERVRSVVDEHALAEAVRRLSSRVQVDRLEATIEAHRSRSSSSRSSSGCVRVCVACTERADKTRVEHQVLNPSSIKA